MSWVKDTFFGGAADKAADAQVRSLEEAMQYQQEAAEQARDDVLGLYGPGYGEMMDGYQAAQDQIASGITDTSNIYKQATQQANTSLQQGNQGSINALLGRNAFNQQSQTTERGPSIPKPVMPDPVPAFPGTGRDMRLMSGGLQTGGNQSRPVEPDQIPVGENYQEPQPDANNGTEQRQRPEAIRSMFGENGRPIMSTQSLSSARLPNDMRSIDQTGRVIDEPGRVTMPGTAVPGSGIPQPIDGQQSLDNAMEQANIGVTELPSVTMGGQPQMQQPDVSGIGLSGAEQALQTGVKSSENALTGGLRSAINTTDAALQGQVGALRQGFGGAEQAVQQAGGQAMQQLREGFGQARSDIDNTLGMTNQTYEQGIDTLGAARDPALSKITQGVQAATGRLDPYSDAGQSALQREAAMSGALGQEAQQQAYNEFSESPAQKFARERQEEALLRNASATGGLRAGSTLSALQEQAAGIAAQQEQRYLDNLRNLASRGQQAAGTQAGFEQQGGMAQSDVIQNIAGQQAQMRGQQAGTQANLGSQKAQFGAQQGQALSGVSQNVGQQVSGLRSNLGQAGQNISQMQYGTGQNISGLRSGVGQDMANLRMGVGQQVSGQMSGLGQQLAQNQLNLGNQLVGLTTGANQNIANLLQGQGEQGYNSRMQLAQILANIASGQGTNLANLQGQIGQAQAGGITGSAAGAQSGVGTAAGIAAAFSDANLKENIKPVMSAGQINLYSWTWKENDVIPKELQGTQDIGVIAQEVEQHYPELVTSKNGYKAVYYSKLAEALNE